jgi:hypothetical protein
MSFYVVIAITISYNSSCGEMAEYGRRRSPAKRVSWETGIEGSNPSLSANLFAGKKIGEISSKAKKVFDGYAFLI